MALVELKETDFLSISLMYASRHNICRLDAYHLVGLGNRCFLHPDGVERLMALEPKLKEVNLKLKVFDAYRPPQAHDMLKDRIPVKGLFAETARKSLHCHGCAVDVCLTDIYDNELDFPTKVDAYTPEYAEQLANGVSFPYEQHFKKADYAYENPADEQAIIHRDLLRGLMESVGFEALSYEWWHFNLLGKEKYPFIHFSVNENKECSFTPEKE